jgi:hypothetical protein
VRDKLISWLGGYLDLEWESLSKQSEIYREQLQNYKVMNSSLIEQLKELNERRNHLEDVLMNRLGLIGEPLYSNSGTIEKSSLEPIQTLPRSWARAKRALEREDYMRAIKEQLPPDA